MNFCVLSQLGSFLRYSHSWGWIFVLEWPTYFALSLLTCSSDVHDPSLLVERKNSVFGVYFGLLRKPIHLIHKTVSGDVSSSPCDHSSSANATRDNRCHHLL